MKFKQKQTLKQKLDHINFKYYKKNDERDIPFEKLVISKQDDHTQLFSSFMTATSLDSNIYTYPKTILVIGNTGTMKTRFSEYIANGWWIDGGVNNRYQANQVTSMDHLIDNYLDEIVKRGKKIDMKPLAWLDDISSINSEVANELLQVLSVSNPIVKSSKSGISLSLKDVNWIFTSVDSIDELNKKYKSNFVDCISEYVLSMKPYANLSSDIKKAVIDFFIQETLDVFNINDIYIEKVAIDYLINQSFTNQNIRDLSNVIHKTVGDHYRQSLKDKSENNNDIRVLREDLKGLIGC